MGERERQGVLNQGRDTHRGRDRGRQGYGERVRERNRDKWTNTDRQTDISVSLPGFLFFSSIKTVVAYLTPLFLVLRPKSHLLPCSTSQPCFGFTVPWYYLTIELIQPYSW